MQDKITDSIAKKIKFELIPQGRTIETIKEKGLLEKEEKLLKNEIIVQPAYDAFIKDLINKGLESLHRNFRKLSTNGTLYTNKEQADEDEIEKKNKIDFIIKQFQKTLPDSMDTILDVRNPIFLKSILPMFVSENQSIKNKKQILSCINELKEYAPLMNEFASKKNHTIKRAAEIVMINFEIFHNNIDYLKINKRILESEGIQIDFQNIDFIIEQENYYRFITPEGIKNYNSFVYRLNTIVNEINKKRQRNSGCNTRFLYRVKNLKLQVYMTHENPLFIEDVVNDSDVKKTLSNLLDFLPEKKFEDITKKLIAFFSEEANWANYIGHLNVLSDIIQKIKETHNMLIDKDILKKDKKLLGEKESTALILRYLSSIREFRHNINVIYKNAEDIKEKPLFYNFIEETIQNLDASIYAANKIKKYLAPSLKDIANEKDICFGLVSKYNLSWWNENDEKIRQKHGLFLERSGKYYFAILTPDTRVKTLIYDKSTDKPNYRILSQSKENGTNKNHLKWIKVQQIDNMVNNGELLLFQIHHRHLYKNKKNPDQNVKKLLEILSDNNFKHPSIFLSTPSISWRKAIIPKEVTYPSGCILVNKKDINGNKIPQDIYHEICQYYNNGLPRKHLSKETRDILCLVKVKKAKKDIIKNNRYTKEKFFLTIKCV